MKKLICALALAVCASFAGAQVVEKGRTFADLTATHPCSAALDNRIARVTDCDAADDIGDGDGAFQCWALCDGSAPWAAVAIGAGAGGLPGNDEVTEAMLKAVNGATDEYLLTYESTVGDFEWAQHAPTASALAANGANCSAGSYPLGVDASGAAESCTVAGTIGGSTGATDNAVQCANGTGGSTIKACTALNIANASPPGGLIGTLDAGTSDIVLELKSGNAKDQVLRFVRSGSNTWVVGVLETSFATAAEDFAFYDYANTAIDFIIRDTTGYVAIPSDSQYQFSSTTSAEGAADTALGRVAAGQIAVSNATNGQATNFKTSATTVNMSGATSTATGLFPAKVVRLGVSFRVTTTITSGDGCTSISAGDGTDPDLYAATKALTSGTTANFSDATADPTVWSATAGDVVFTCNGGTASGGVVRVVAHYIDTTAPTS